MLRHLFITYFFLSFSINALSQENLNGFWYSKDSTRVFIIKNDSLGNNATIFRSTRKEDSVGFQILTDIKFNSKTKKYNAIIHSVIDDVPRRSSFSISTKHNALKITIPRFYIFPVHIYWFKGQ